MIRKVWLVALLCFGATICFATQKSTQPIEVKTFELYSWQDAKGGWVFSLLPGIISSGYHPDVIMRRSSALPGKEKLKVAVSELPTGSDIYWLDHATGMHKEAKAWNQIKYPPTDVIAEVRKFCEARGMKLHIETPKELKTEKHGNLSQ